MVPSEGWAFSSAGPRPSAIKSCTTLTFHKLKSTAMLSAVAGVLLMGVCSDWEKVLSLPHSSIKEGAPPHFPLASSPLGNQSLIRLLLPRQSRASNTPHTKTILTLNILSSIDPSSSSSSSLYPLHKPNQRSVIHESASFSSCNVFTAHTTEVQTHRILCSHPIYLASPAHHDASSNQMERWRWPPL